ncbi:leucine-rich repeat domain-containing protein, partial [Porticoccaceae bacterium]|nr:leucine-rich repeat domain-containing protein [Porticoccaceae bacterium]MDA9014995.1 leucine-rich repeat domain-containing protein [Porticoccaceae bacterium]
MFLRQFIQFVLGLVFLVTSSFALSNTEFTYISNDNSVEILGCENICPLNLVIPNEIDGLPVTKIGWAAFSNNHLTSVFIPNSVTTIANLAFDNNNLSSLVIPESVETIGWLAFSNNNLQAVSLPSGIERLEDGVFYSNELTDILIPNNVTFIGVDAFRENDIRNITLSNDLMLISSYAFSGNDIRNLTIPSTVVSIDERAFFQNHLASVTFLGDRPAIGKEAFALSSENDESYWGTTYQNCSNDISTDSMNCDTIYRGYSTGDGYFNLGFCEGTSGWPGESVFVYDSQEYYGCNGSTPEV